ncbi:hypothetical protein [Thiocystis minor]|uniref:hypothetical protein n=1 Tax=Thiocystis minor TaxID=61597 RepID=UPI001A939D9F|nr:hypothetical protein [Thiocystis minor]
MIGKADAALHLDTLLGPMPDSVLLLALTKAYRAKSAPAFARIAGELASRLGLSVETTNIPSLPIIVETTDIQPVEIPVVTTEIQPSIIPVVTTDIPGLSKDKAARDRRIRELEGIPERRASEILKSEGFKCSPRTVSNVRKRLAP